MCKIEQVVSLHQHTTTSPPHNQPDRHNRTAHSVRCLRFAKRVKEGNHFLLWCGFQYAHHLTRSNLWFKPQTRSNPEQRFVLFFLPVSQFFCFFDLVLSIVYTFVCDFIDSLTPHHLEGRTVWAPHAPTYVVDGLTTLFVCVNVGRGRAVIGYYKPNTYPNQLPRSGKLIRRQA